MGLWTLITINPSYCALIIYFLWGTHCGRENNFWSLPSLFISRVLGWSYLLQEKQKLLNSEHLVLAVFGDPLLILICISHIDHFVCVRQRISPASLDILLVCFSRRCLSSSSVPDMSIHSAMDNLIRWSVHLWDIHLSPHGQYVFLEGKNYIFCFFAVFYST